VPQGRPVVLPPTMRPMARILRTMYVGAGLPSASLPLAMALLFVLEIVKALPLMKTRP